MRDAYKAVAAINAALPAGGARAHLVATFADLPPHVQDEALEAGATADSFVAVTMAKGQVYVVQDKHTGLAEFEASILHESSCFAVLSMKEFNPANL